MSKPRPQSAAEIIVGGHVQGVGYRNFAQRKAAQLGLRGYVMNLRDGRVRVRPPRPVGSGASATQKSLAAIARIAEDASHLREESP